MTDLELQTSLKERLDNPAVSNDELKGYIASAKREVSSGNYSANDYIEQILDTACEKLRLDGKFPEIMSTSQNGLTTSFADNDPDRFKKRITERRQAALIGAGAGLE
jgi:hypothetical protein